MKSVMIAGAVLILGFAAYWFVIGDAGRKKLTQMPQDNPRGLISLTFDDGWKSIYENAVPLLIDAGFKSTQYITTNPWRDEYDQNYMKPEQVVELFQQGHEIGAHTITHRSLKTLPEASIRTEIRGSKSDIEFHNISVTTLSYPLGDYSDLTTSIVKEAGFSGAVTAWRELNNRDADPYVLKRHQLTNTSTIEEVKGWIDQAIRDDTWLILTFHEIDSGGRAYEITPELFLEIIKYIQSTGVRVVTVREGIDTFIEK